MSKKAEAAPPLPRPLRVALVWNETLQEDELLTTAEPVTLGAKGTFPMPGGVTAAELVEVLTPAEGGLALKTGPALGGALFRGGTRHDVGDLSGTVPLDPSDYGVVTFGPVALFFQFVRPVTPPPRSLGDVDVGTVAAVLLAFFLAFVVLVVSFVDYERMGGLERDPFELDEDLVSRFLVTPPPDDLLETLQTESGTETEDPGLRTQEDTGGERARDEEGRVGREDADQEDTQIQGEVSETIAAAPEGSLLGALGGGGQNAIAAALDVPDIGAILGGMGDTPTMVGRGSGGAGLRGLGMGGGGTGAGSLFGAGAIGTGVGAGMGGRGMGAGGPGVMGRATMERTVRVQRGMARTNGYLSPEQILRVVRANQNAIKYCYENEVQRQPNLRGAVTLDWTVGLDGRVTQARIARSTLRSSRVEGCMVRQVRRWRFPRPDGGVCRVQFPFNFGVSGG